MAVLYYICIGKGHSLLTQFKSNIMVAQQDDHISELTLKVLLMAEITRYKFGGRDGMSLTNPKIERAARHRFAEMCGISKQSKPATFIKEIGRAYRENGIGDQFESTLKSFKLDPVKFK